MTSIIIVSAILILFVIGLIVKLSGNNTPQPVIKNSFISQSDFFKDFLKTLKDSSTLNDFNFLKALGINIFEFTNVTSQISKNIQDKRAGVESAFLSEKRFFDIFDRCIIKNYAPLKTFKYQYIFYTQTTNIEQILKYKNILIEFLGEPIEVNNVFESEQILDIINGFKSSSKDDLYLRWIIGNVEILYQYTAIPQQQLSLFFNVH